MIVENTCYSWTRVPTMEHMSTRIIVMKHYTCEFGYEAQLSNGSTSYTMQCLLAKRWSTASSYVLLEWHWICNSYYEMTLDNFIVSHWALSERKYTLSFGKHYLSYRMNSINLIKYSIECFQTLTTKGMAVCFRSWVGWFYHGLSCRENIATTLCLCDKTHPNSFFDRLVLMVQFLFQLITLRSKC